MKAKVEKNRADFEDYRKPNPSVSLIDASDDSSSNLLSAAAQTGIGRICFEIGYVCGAQGINLTNLLVYISDHETFVKIIEKMGFLNNPAALEKLLQDYVDLHTPKKGKSNKNSLNKRMLIQMKEEDINESLQPSHRRSLEPTAIPEELTFSFGCKISLNSLKTILQTIYIRTPFVASQECLDNLALVLMSDDLTKTQVEVNVCCNTNKFRVIKEVLNPHFDSLSAANIGRSKLFRSKKGKIISATGLGSAKCSVLKQKHFLEDLLK